MRNYSVDLRIRLNVDADNPGAATSAAVDRIRKALELHDPEILGYIQMEAAAYPTNNLFHVAFPKRS